MYVKKFVRISKIYQPKYTEFAYRKFQETSARGAAICDPWGEESTPVLSLSRQYGISNLLQWLESKWLMFGSFACGWLEP